LKFLKWRTGGALAGKKSPVFFIDIEGLICLLSQVLLCFLHYIYGGNMNRYAVIFFALLTSFFLPHLEALNRDYRSDCDEDESYQNYYKPYCLYHAPGNYPDGISHELFYRIPQTGPAECCQCYDLSCYLGYIDLDFRKYLPHLKRHLEYCSQHNDCVCYWPEYSQEAAQISDTAYLLFRDLISTTALSNLQEIESEQKEFINNPTWFLNKHGLTISFIVQQFRFSDYYHICRDIEDYAKSKYNEREAAKIKDNLDDILEAIYPKFFALLTSCYKKHPSSDIDQEIRFMKFLVNDLSGLEETIVSSKAISSFSVDSSNTYDVSEFIIANLQTANIPVELENKGILCEKKKISRYTAQKTLLDVECSANIRSSSTVNSAKSVVYSPQSDIFLEQGTLFNSLLLYKEAIQVLTQAIQLNSSNREAYIERAMAYFETNQLSLALQDYESAKKLMVTPPFKLSSHKAMTMMTVYVPENKTDFSKGLISGTVDGAKVSTEEFIPSIFSCCRGILNGLWAFVCSPIEVSQEMVDTAYAIGEFVSSHSTEECFHCVVPELKELSLSWNKINDHSRGQKIGYIIGKYGIDIFAPAGALKGLNKVRALKRANTMCTLESCAASQVKQIKILEESSKLAAKRQSLVSEITTQGRIYPKNANAVPHILQDKHAWEKVVTIKQPIKAHGNIEENFKSIVTLLEKEGIMSESYFNETLFSNGCLRVNKHRKVINGQVVEAIFEVNTETKFTLLQDAWVITNK
jgi:tetratricopeptide (TPR) repeat protein